MEAWDTETIVNERRRRTAGDVSSVTAKDSEIKACRTASWQIIQAVGVGKQWFASFAVNGVIMTVTPL